MTAEQLLSIMSPLTLASLIADIRQQDKGASGDELQIEKLAKRALVAIVGDIDEAMVADAGREIDDYNAAVAEAEMDD